MSDSKPRRKFSHKTRSLKHFFTFSNNQLSLMIMTFGQESRQLILISLKLKLYNPTDASIYICIHKACMFLLHGRGINNVSGMGFHVKISPLVYCQTRASIYQDAEAPRTTRLSPMPR